MKGVYLPMKYYTRRQAAHWLKFRVHYGDPSVHMNTRFLKRLKNECRLLPAKHTIFGDRYSEKQLKTYANEMKF